MTTQRIISISPIILIILGCAISILLLIACIHFCIADTKLVNIRLRIMTIISLMFELILIILYYISSNDISNINEWISMIPYYLRYLNMFIITIIAYYLIKCPELGTKTTNNLSKFTFNKLINYFWLFVSIMHILWISNCILFTIIDNNNSNTFQISYFFGLYIYILLGIINIFIISFKLKEQITKSLLKLNNMNHSKFENYVYDNNDDNDNSNNDNKTKNTNIEIDKIMQLNNTKYKLNLMMMLLICYILFIIFSFYYKISNLLNSNSDNIIINTFIIDYITIIILYIFITGYNWVSFRNISCIKCMNCIKYMKFRKIQKQRSLSLNIKSNSMIINIKQLKEGNNKRTLKPTDSIISYTEQDKAELSKTHLNIDLKNINSRGEIIGKRGTKKPTKIRRNNYESNIDIKLELNDLGSITELDDAASNFDDGIDDGISIISGATYENTLKMEHFIEDVLEQMSFTETTKNNISPINTIVFEFSDVLCTQIEKLNGKTHIFLSEKSLKQKQLYFGGEERLEMITNWLYQLKQNNSNSNYDLKFFINTEQETKTIIQLLKDVNFLQHFVSRNENNPNKLISHIIGWDHKISQQTDRRKHLILLELLQFLHRSHCQLLYVSHDKDIIQHLDNIQICKTYLCKRKGLTQTDLDIIQEMFF